MSFVEIVSVAGLCGGVAAGGGGDRRKGRGDLL